jgi:transposase InsO family protein
VFGKQTLLKFSRSIHTTKAILDYVHTNLWGDTPVTSIGGGKYLLIFIDDFSRKVWVYILKSKDETIACFRQWKAMVETQIERKVKYVRSDNGTEFCSREFENYCWDAGIIRHHTTVGTP